MAKERMIMMSCFCGMVDQQKVFSLTPSQDHFQRSSSLQISDKLQAGFERAQKVQHDNIGYSYSVIVKGTRGNLLKKQENVFLQKNL